jgi:hypothetical protein
MQIGDHYTDYAGLSEDSLCCHLLSISLTHIHLFAHHKHYTSLRSRNDSTARLNIGNHHRNLAISGKHSHTW